jgi:hypothetical protein
MPPSAAAVAEPTFPATSPADAATLAMPSCALPLAAAAASCAVVAAVLAGRLKAGLARRWWRRRRARDRPRDMERGSLGSRLRAGGVGFSGVVSCGETDVHPETLRNLLLAGLPGCYWLAGLARSPGRPGFHVTCRGKSRDEWLMHVAHCG